MNVLSLKLLAVTTLAFTLAACGAADGADGDRARRTSRAQPLARLRRQWSPPTAAPPPAR
jgi:hypothetical protein